MSTEFTACYCVYAVPVLGYEMSIDLIVSMLCYLICTKFAPELHEEGRATQIRQL